ncbi:unnamed protein product [Chondrus crispus]|uniref:UvrABC system protein B n=1 Tax=Chondrus crispus TaxID=2769 RepID=R7Q9B9_CHOCR|nr:unnamed protein product [Chondrus crispus]CDF34393.1 unnamed protein product [Chondrus crispus]|eukprot:XP_005714212.1 unnamed protein product [Chondrus crispus]
MCRRRSRFATKEAHSVLNVLRPLVENDTIHSFVVAIDGPAPVCSKAATLVEEAGGELLGKESLDAALAFLTEGEKESRHPSEQGENANVLACSARDGTAGTIGGAARKEGNTSRLRFLSRQRRKDAQKRRRHHFELCAHHQPAGDQPKAISFLTDGLLEKGKSFQTLHGVTGSGKTFMMANIIAKADRPALILAPNKTLAAQLCNELSNLFPKNRVEFFVSSFKFYQPEAYLPNSDKYIAKASAIDPDVDRLRHAATRSLFERTDTIVVASVSSIYGLGLPTEYLESSIRIHVGDKLEGGVSELTESLENVQYVEASGKGITPRGSFNVTSDIVEIAPPWEAEGILYRILFDNSVIVRMEFLNTNTSESIDLGHEVVLYPARHFVTPKGQIEAAILQIEEETKKCTTAFRAEGKELEASRLEERVATDMEMMRKVGFCSGAENYSLYLSKRTNGITTSPPRTLLDYMPRDGKWLLFIDESHVTVPQLGAMYAGNAARKKKLVRHGFRLPSAMENRPLNSKEFWEKAHQTIFVSATPGNLELERSGSNGVCEAVIRPTGIVDPSVEVVPTKGQVEHLVLALAKVAAAGGRAIVTTLTKRFAEDLADCISRKPAIHGVLDRPLRVSFLHSEIDSVGRMQVLEAMRGDINLGSESSAPKLDVIVGVNLLREGIDLPAVRLVAILDADSEGFLRGETALIQTIGRAARNTEGHVVMYADTVTSSMHRAITETRRRRRLQMAHNSINDIIPSGVGAGTHRSLNAEEKTLLDRIRKLKLEAGESLKEKTFGKISDKAVQERDHFKFAEAPADLTDLGDVRQKMLMAANAEDFETAALLRDRLVSLEQR